MDRKLTLKEKLGVFAAIIMFLSIGMIMGGSSAGNMKLVYAGGGVFTLGALIAIWLLIDSKKDEDELFN
jgi:hypothetical protein